MCILLEQLKYILDVNVSIKLVFHEKFSFAHFSRYSKMSDKHGVSIPVQRVMWNFLTKGADERFNLSWSIIKSRTQLCAMTHWIGHWCAFVCFRGAELFQATIVKAVKARLEEERKSVEQLKRQWDLKYLTSFMLCFHSCWFVCLFVCLLAKNLFTDFCKTWQVHRALDEEWSTGFWDWCCFFFC